jgi:pyrimidine operon attenuation protein/uracil phosphoribosyltransferase
MVKTYDLQALLDQLEQQLRTYINDKQLVDPVLVGIHTSGVWLAQELYQRLALPEEPGQLDVSFYRDDLYRSGLPKPKQPSRMPIQVDDRHVLLVDDILYSGRTVRAAMNELFDYGRPKTITLIALVSRGGRELPIEAQVCALHEEPGHDREYVIEGPEPLSMTLIPRKTK